MNKSVFSVTMFCLFSLSITAGCASQKAEGKVDISVTQTPVIAKTVEEDDDKIITSDFRGAVITAVRNMIRSGALENPSGERYVVIVSRVMDTTKQDFDLDEIAQKIRAELEASRKVRVVSVNAKSVSPQITVSGRITQRTAYVRGGKKRQEFYLHLNLTEAKSGMPLWEGVTPVVKKKR